MFFSARSAGAGKGHEFAFAETIDPSSSVCSYVFFGPQCEVVCRKKDRRRRMGVYSLKGIENCLQEYLDP
jgi:hypothetical protein